MPQNGSKISHVIKSNAQKNNTLERRPLKIIAYPIEPGLYANSRVNTLPLKININ